MKISNKYFIFFVFIVTPIKLISTALIEITENVIRLEELYYKIYQKNKSLLYNFCYLPKEIKYSICEFILTQNYYSQDLEIYFNATAAFNESPECIEVTLDFYSLYEVDTPITQQVFPCYGRHYPMRTAYNIDDFYDTLYLSSAYNFKSVFVYWNRKASIIENKFHIIDLIILPKNVNDFPPRNIQVDDLSNEMLSLQEISFNTDGSEIEMNYARAVILHNLKPDRKDAVCDLKKNHKLRLCKAVFLREIYTEVNKWKFDETNFLSHSTECEERTLAFAHVKDYNNPDTPLRIKQRMYPCYGKYQNDTDDMEIDSGSSFDLLYLSSGFRPNSIIVYIDIGDYLMSFYEFLENFDLIRQVYFPFSTSFKRTEPEPSSTSASTSSTSGAKKYRSSSMDSSTSSDSLTESMRNLFKN